MIKKILLFIIFFGNFSVVYADLKNDILAKLKETKNISFDFRQTIENKNEDGECIIEYPGKIFCKYNNLKKKIIVSNGRSLVIKNLTDRKYYIYKLEETLLSIILDKKKLIDNIKKLNGRIIEDKYYNFVIKNKGNEINLFFDIKNLNLVGWQTEDVYKNLVITFISSIKINQKIKKNTFKLPNNS